MDISESFKSNINVSYIPQTMVHPLYNIGVDAAMEATQYFNNLPVPQTRENSQTTSANTSSQEAKTQT